jgi:hypothetical protein
MGQHTPRHHALELHVNRSFFGSHVQPAQPVNFTLAVSFTYRAGRSEGEVAVASFTATVQYVYCSADRSSVPELRKEQARYIQVDTRGDVQVGEGRQRRVTLMLNLSVSPFHRDAIRSSQLGQLNGTRIAALLTR